MQSISQKSKRYLCKIGSKVSKNKNWILLQKWFLGWQPLLPILLYCSHYLSILGLASTILQKWCSLAYWAAVSCSPVVYRWGGAGFGIWQTPNPCTTTTHAPIPCTTHAITRVNFKKRPAIALVLYLIVLLLFLLWNIEIKRHTSPSL